MNYESVITESLRDATHEFRANDSKEHCRHCGRPRWAHLYDGHLSRPDHKYTLADTKYRPGPHPYWTRPGSRHYNDKPNHKTPYLQERNPSDGIPGRTSSYMPRG